MRKTRLFLVYISFFTCISSFAQSDAIFNIAYENSQVTSFNTHSVGINIELKPSRVISLNYPLTIGFAAPRRAIYFYTGLPQAVGFELLSNSGGSTAINVLSILLIAVPESIDFHIHSSENFSVAPYISPYGYELRNNFPGVSRDPKISGEIGIKARVHTDANIFLTLMSGYKVLYGNGFRGVTIGANLGFGI